MHLKIFPNNPKNVREDKEVGGKFLVKGVKIVQCDFDSHSFITQLSTVRKFQPVSLKNLQQAWGLFQSVSFPENALVSNFNILSPILITL